MGRRIRAVGPERRQGSARVDRGTSFVAPPAAVPGVDALDELVGLDVGPLVVVMIEPLLQLRVVDHVKVAAEEQGAANGDDLGDDLGVVVFSEGVLGAREALDGHAVGTKQALCQRLLFGVELPHPIQPIALAPLLVPPALLAQSARGEVIRAFGFELLGLQENVLAERPSAEGDTGSEAIGDRWDNLHESAGELDVGGVEAPVCLVDETVLVEVGFQGAQGSPGGTIVLSSSSCGSGRRNTWMPWRSK